MLYASCDEVLVMKRPKYSILQELVRPVYWPIMNPGAVLALPVASHKRTGAVHLTVH